MAHGRARQKLLLRGIQAHQSENQRVRLAHQRRFAPETHQFRRAFADDAGEGHAVETARSATVWTQSPPRTRIKPPDLAASSARGLRSLRAATISGMLRARLWSSSSAKRRGAQSPKSVTS